MRARGLHGCVVGNSFHSSIPAAQQFICAILNPLRHMSISRPATGWVVLEAAILRRIVRWSNDDAIREVILAPLVVNENGTRDDRRRSYSVILLDYGFDVVCSQHFKCSALGRFRHPVRVFAHKEWAIRALAAPVLTDRLRDGENMRFGERTSERRASVSAGAEDNHLI